MSAVAIIARQEVEARKMARAESRTVPPPAPQLPQQSALESEREPGGAAEAEE